jgi:enolase
MLKFKNIYARQVLDSRGNPTIEVEVTCNDGSFASAIVPSGASTGVHEAVELRDNDKKVYGGKGVLKAVENVNKILFPKLKNENPEDQLEIDKKMIELDGTYNKSNLGANAILGVSLATAKAVAVSKKQYLYEYVNNIAGNPEMLLPTPMMNVINGGSHADSGLEIQEFMIFPTNTSSFKESLQVGVEIFHELKRVLKNKNMVTSVGDEGGFAPHLSSNEEAIDCILQASKNIGHYDKIQIAMDAAASEFYKNGKYTIDNKEIDQDELVKYYDYLCSKYPIISIEDAFAEDDFEGFGKMYKNQNDKIQLVGDDLFVTNTKRIQIGIDKKLANSVLIKPNQIGTLSETIEAVKMAQHEGWTTIMSHRSGETEDSIIADLAVGLGTGQIKTGSLSRSDRISKYNQLIRISERSNGKIKFQGKIR